MELSNLSLAPGPYDRGGYRFNKTLELQLMQGFEKKNVLNEIHVQISVRFQKRS